MKKLFLWALMLSATLFGGGIFTSCSDDSDDAAGAGSYLFSVEAESTTAYSVTIKVTSQGIADFAYIVSDVDQPRDVIYADGKKLVPETTEQTFTLNGFEPLSSYTLQFAAKQQNNTFYKEVVKVHFETGDFGDDEITVYNIGYKNFSAHIAFPDEVAQRGNVLKWAVNDYALFNNGWSIAHKMNVDDDTYATWFNSDKTLSITNNDEDRYAKYEDGSVNYDYWYYEPLVPNQILYLTVGEYTYVSEDEMYVYDEELGYEVDNTDGHGKPGYYKALFDQAAFDADNGGGIMPWRVSPLSEEAFPDQSQYWSGYYRIYTLRTLAPEPFAGNVTVDLSGLKPMGGQITLTPDENVPMFATALLDLSTWDMILQDYVADQEMETIQAYLTTTHAYRGAGIKYLRGATTLVVDDEVWVEGPGSQYKLVVIAFDGEEMIGQNFTVYDITLPEKQLPAPTVEVAAIANPKGQESPYELWFNVKCTSVETAPAFSAQYAFSMERDWEASFSYGSTPTDVVLYAYKYFDEGEVAQMNTDAGCNVCFATLPGQRYGFGAVVLNEEGTNSEAGYIVVESAAEPTPERVESDYFTSLQGQWTLNATVSYTYYDWNTFEEVAVEEEFHTLVTIGDLTAPESLSEEVYTGYENAWPARSREETDAAFADLKTRIAAFNEQTRNYNRILCQGYDLYPIDWGTQSATFYASPYDIFYKGSMGELTFYGAAEAIFDFGPKWFIEVDQEGNLRVPFNSMTMPPASNHSGTYFLAGVNSQDAAQMQEFVVYDPANESTAYFPVKVEGDTLTIEPFVHNGSNYYMHLVNAEGYLSAFVTSPITLTRGWSGEALPMSQVKSQKKQLKSDCRIAPVQRPKGVTHLGAPRQRVEIGAVTAEQFRANVASFRR